MPGCARPGLRLGAIYLAVQDILCFLPGVSQIALAGDVCPGSLAGQANTPMTRFEMREYFWNDLAEILFLELVWKAPALRTLIVYERVLFTLCYNSGYRVPGDICRTVVKVCRPDVAWVRIPVRRWPPPVVIEVCRC